MTLKVGHLLCVLNGKVGGQMWEWRAWVSKGFLEDGAPDLGSRCVNLSCRIRAGPGSGTRDTNLFSELGAWESGSSIQPAPSSAAAGE